MRIQSRLAGINPHNTAVKNFINYITDQTARKKNVTDSIQKNPLHPTRSSTFWHQSNARKVYCKSL